MGTPVFVDTTYTGTGFQEPIMLNRWAWPSYSVVVALGTTGDYTLEGTINRINEGQTPLWFELAGLVNVITDITDTIQDTPLEAIRMNIVANDTSIRFQVMQQGDA